MAKMIRLVKELINRKSKQNYFPGFDYSTVYFNLAIFKQFPLSYLKCKAQGRS